MPKKKPSREQSRTYTQTYRKADPERARAICRENRRSRIKNAGRPPGPVCEICGRVFESTPHYDHDHTTGAFRGWLCASCNLGLGKVGDYVAALEAAVAYLKRANGDQA